MPRKAAKPTPAKQLGHGLAQPETNCTKRPQVEKLAAAIAAVLDALEFTSRMKLKILADCAESIYMKSLTKAECAHRRKTTRRADHGIFS